MSSIVVYIPNYREEHSYMSLDAYCYTTFLQYVKYKYSLGGESCLIGYFVK